VPKGSTTPRIADLLPVSRASDSCEEASLPERQDTSNIAIYDDSNLTRQLNARVPVGLYSNLLRAQAELTVYLGEKPSIQAMLAACLRLGLDEMETLTRVVSDDLRSAKDRG
jgi:hypothetical protein